MHLGSEVTAVGYAEGRRDAMQATIVGVGSTIVVSPGVNCPGDPGGPLVLNRIGEVLGINFRELPVGIWPCHSSGFATKSVFQRIDQYIEEIA